MMKRLASKMGISFLKVSEQRVPAFRKLAVPPPFADNPEKAF
jgi:hypothetical protein